MGKKIPTWQVMCVFLFLIICLMYSMGMLQTFFGDAFACGYAEAHIPLILSAILAAGVAIANGYKWSYLEAGILASIDRSMQAILILLTVGMLIGSWIAAGVVPAMIYYGLLILKPSIFLMASCVLCGIVALATGSSWTTAGTIGIALIGIGQGLGMEPAMTAGAIVSGAYFGDKMSPLSDTTNLAPAMAGSNLFDHIRHMIWTVTPSLIIALIIYGILGTQASGGGGQLETVGAIQEGIKGAFVINPALLIPPVVVILIVALRLPALPGLMGGVFIGCILGSIFQGIALGDWFGLVHYGFTYEVNDAAIAASQYGVDLATTTQNDLASLLSRGGMSSMLWTVNLIMCAMCFGGVMDAAGMLSSLAGILLKAVRGTGMLVVVTIASSIFINIIGSDQYLSIILPGRMYKEAWEDQKLDPKNFSRCLEDGGTITSCLVPWNTCGATMQTFLGVKTWGGPGGGYGRYAFLNLINPLVSIFYGFTGISMVKMSDEAYEKILAEREATKAEALKATEA